MARAPQINIDIYNAVNSFLGNEHRCFITKDGTPGSNWRKEAEDDSGTEALWHLGNKAFQALQIKDRADWDHRRDCYLEKLKLWRKNLVRVIAAGWVSNTDGSILTVESYAIGSRSNYSVLSLWRSIFSHMRGKIKFCDEPSAEDLLLSVFPLIEEALIARDLGSSDAIAASVDAANCLADALALNPDGERQRGARQTLARQAASYRYAKDPKQAEKQFVKRCYDEWNQGVTRYKSAAAFARDMLKKCVHLTSQKKIEDWVRDWRENTPSA